MNAHTTIERAQGTGSNPRMRFQSGQPSSGAGSRVNATSAVAPSSSAGLTLMNFDLGVRSCAAPAGNVTTAMRTAD